MNVPSQSWIRLREKAFREHFVDAVVRQSIPYQIRALMKAQGLNQEKLAERSGLTQGAISRAANPKYGKLSLATCVRVAAGLDVAFVGRFVPFSELDRWFRHLAAESADVPTFSQEDETFSRLGDSRPAVWLPVKSGAERQANFGAGSVGKVQEFFRLTSPPMQRQLGTVHDFTKARGRILGPSANTAMRAVSQ